MKTIQELADIGKTAVIQSETRVHSTDGVKYYITQYPSFNDGVACEVFAAAVREEVLKETSAEIEHLRGIIDDLKKQIEELRETHDMQIAAICTRAGQNSRTSGPFISRGHPYWTPAYDEVAVAVKREMTHREAREALREDADRLQRTLENQAETIARLQDEAVQDHNTPTLRDQFAMAALSGLLACPSLTPQPESMDEYLSAWAYKYADSMLKAREVKP